MRDIGLNLFQSVFFSFFLFCFFSFPHTGNTVCSEPMIGPSCKCMHKIQDELIKFGFYETVKLNITCLVTCVLCK